MHTIPTEQISAGFYWVRSRFEDPAPPKPELKHSLAIAQVSDNPKSRFGVTIMHEPRSISLDEALAKVDFVERIEQPAT